MSYINLSLIIISMFISNLIFADNKFDIILETGAVWQSRNDFQITPNAGTRIALDHIDSGAFLHYRIEGIYKFNNKHAVRLLYAPSNIEITSRMNTNTNFNGRVFGTNQDIEFNYKFNSYRFTYIYGLTGFGDDEINLGITAKIRDANISLKQNDRTTKYDNIGFVPLIYFEYQKYLAPLWSVNLSLDFAAAPQGRAIDAGLKLRRKIKDRSMVGFGVRTLEGGADNDKVFTFSWFNYAVLDLQFSF